MARPGSRNVCATGDRVGWWLETAQGDWRTAEVLLQNGIHANAAFHLQQAAEKALKAVLTLHGERDTSHSGLGLMVALERRGEKFPAKLGQDLRRLDRCDIDSRYPNGVGGPSETFYDRPMVEELWDALADGRPLQDAGVWQEARQRFQQRLEGRELERTPRGWRTLK